MDVILQSEHHLTECHYAAHYYYTVIVHLKPSFVCFGQWSSKLDVTVIAH